MPDTFHIKVTPDAQDDIQEIILYISNELFAPEAAANLEKEFRENILSLSWMPTRYGVIDLEPWHSEEVRKIHVHNYYIYYWVDEETAVVYVFHVFYVGRDQEKHLTGSKW